MKTNYDAPVPENNIKGLASFLVLFVLSLSYIIILPLLTPRYGPLVPLAAIIPMVAIFYYYPDRRGGLLSLLFPLYTFLYIYFFTFYLDLPLSYFLPSLLSLLLVSLLFYFALLIGKGKTKRSRKLSEFEKEREKEFVVLKKMLHVMMDGPGEGRAFRSLWFDVIYHLAENIGGDFYKFVPIDERYLLTVVGDISGSGYHAAFAALILREIILDLKEGRYIPSEGCEYLNRQFIEKLGDQVEYASLFYCLADTDEQTIEFISCGHNPVFMMRNDGRLEKIHTDGVLIGLNNNVHFESQKTAVAPGDVLVVFTDGLIEFLATAEEDGLVALESLLFDGSSKRGEELRDYLRQHISPRGDRPYRDDILVSLIQF